MHQEPSGRQQLLSQDESNPMLHNCSNEESTTFVIGSNGRRVRCEPGQVQPYDFEQPSFLAAGELRKLRLRHEEIIRSLAARLSVYLRLEVSLQMSKLQSLTYGQFVENLGSPAHVTLFKAEPLKGICLLDVPPRLGLAVVDRLMGGAAQSPDTSRDLTEIEVTLLDQAVQIIVNEWCNHWQSCQDLRPSLLGHENNGRFLQTASRDTVMLCVSIETRVGDCVDQMQLAFPHYTLEPIVKHLAAPAAPKTDPAVKIPAPLRWNAELNDVPAEVRAEWQGLELTAGELAALKPGDFLMLEPQMASEVRVCIASATRFQGRLGTRGKDWAIELTQPLSA